MTKIVPPDVMCFDLETGLAKALGKKVETFLVDIKSDTYKFRIGLRWRFEIGQDELEDLWQDVETPSALRDKFDSYKANHLAFMSYEKR